VSRLQQQLLLLDSGGVDCSVCTRSASHQHQPTTTTTSHCVSGAGVSPLLVHEQRPDRLGPDEDGVELEKRWTLRRQTRL
jgi:hypothetical protein